MVRGQLPNLVWFLKTYFGLKILLFSIIFYLSVDKLTSGRFLLLFGLRYYELGPNDPPYAAKFYDCCGAEDPEASGCNTAFHVSYDDD